MMVADAKGCARKGRGVGGTIRQNRPSLRETGPIHCRHGQEHEGEANCSGSVFKSDSRKAGANDGGGEAGFSDGGSSGVLKAMGGIQPIDNVTDSASRRQEWSIIMRDERGTPENYPSAVKRLTEW